VSSESTIQVVPPHAAARAQVTLGWSHRSSSRCWSMRPPPTRENGRGAIEHRNARPPTGDGHQQQIVPLAEPVSRAPSGCPDVPAHTHVPAPFSTTPAVAQRAPVALGATEGQRNTFRGLVPGTTVAAGRPERSASRKSSPVACRRIWQRAYSTRRRYRSGSSIKRRRPSNFRSSRARRPRRGTSRSVCAWCTPSPPPRRTAKRRRRPMR